ncbi:hypothetical protein FSPOR_4508 [Fusarium sporotrichioides]|uniref:Uncharacterized protein n=1 Tax=Fusarium sporotrichioides TaxID=5514 RepID=A0A395SBC0_FUSSP|nr:hypothetical protein FSPOR_4508 [Fusarium sporotrichioides]
MRSVAFLLATGLGLDFALAGPCKPRTSETVATTVASDTTAAIIITSSEVETTTAALDTSIATTTTTSEGETTTAEVTTTAPAATPTFTIVGRGGSVNGAPLQGVDQDGSILLFNPESGNARTRTFILDPDTGRLRDKDTGTTVCAYYGFADSPSAPANIGYCQNGNTGPNRYYDYLTCEIVGGNLACTAPKASCPEDEDGNQTCVTDSTGGVNNQFYYKYQSGSGYYLYISSGNPGGYTSVDILAQSS